MTTTTQPTDVRQLLTEDIDAQIAELRAKKAKLTAAGKALVAAADDIDDRKQAVKEAEKTFADRRQALIDLGMKPREITRLLKELRETNTEPSPAETVAAADTNTTDTADNEDNRAEPQHGESTEQNPTQNPTGGNE